MVDIEADINAAAHKPGRERGGFLGRLIRRDSENDKQERRNREWDIKFVLSNLINLGAGIQGEGVQQRREPDDTRVVNVPAGTLMTRLPLIGTGGQEAVLRIHREPHPSGDKRGEPFGGYPGRVNISYSVPGSIKGFEQGVSLYYSKKIPINNDDSISDINQRIGAITSVGDKTRSYKDSSRDNLELWEPFVPALKDLAEQAELARVNPQSPQK